MTTSQNRVLAATLVAALLGFTTTPHANAAVATQQHFASPEEAAQALIAAAKTGEPKALLPILGPEAKAIVDSGDPVADRDALADFVKGYEEANTLEKTSETQVTLATGKDAWPLPIPIVKDDAGWRFDTEAGDDEILARRIGRNELSTIQVCLAFVDAQREYYERDPEKSGLLHYASRVASSPGKRDGLYFQTQEGEEPSPLGELFAAAKAEGYQKKTGAPTPYHGYLYRILDGQGPNATGGAYSYLARGKLLGGFALIAAPASYGNSGVMTFLVNQDGVVFEKDLGPKTASLAQAIKRFDPDETWKRVPDPEEEPMTASE
jgi:hypothetical protein